MSRRLLMGLCAALLTASLPAAAQKTEDDPLSDPKFGQKVVIAAEGIPVSDLLAALSKKAGLALRADPTVSEDKVIVFGPARPLKAVLSDIAALFNDNWRHYTNVEGTEQYVLYREPRAQRYEDGLKTTLTSKMQAQLDEQVRALVETPEQFAKRPEKDWIKQNFAKPILHGRAATRLYSLLDRQQRDLLFSQGYLNVSFNNSRPDDQAAARDAFKEAVAGLQAENERIQKENPEVHIVIDAPENLARHGVRFNLHHENNAGLSALVVQVIMGRASYMTMGDFDSASQWLLPPHGDPYTRKSIPEDARLVDAKDVSAAGKSKGWIEQLHALAEAAERPIIADFYRCPALVTPLTNPDPAPQDGPEKTAKDQAIAALDELSRPRGYLWWVRDQTLLLRKRDWYQQKQYEVPDRWMRTVAGKLKQEKHEPTYADVALLMELSPAQIAGLNNLLASGGGTPDDQDTLAGLQELLQMISTAAKPDAPLFVGSLTPEIIGRIGLPAADADPALRAHAAQFLAARRQIDTPADIAKFRVCLTCYGPLPTGSQEEATPDPRGKVTVVVEWNTGEGQTPFDQRLQLYLPTEVSGDHSAKTKVEIQP